MTQAQLDKQNQHSQLEQQTNTIDLSTQLLFNDSPVFFLKAIEQVFRNATSDQASSEHNNSNTERNAPQIFSEKQQISQEIHN